MTGYSDPGASTSLITRARWAEYMLRMTFDVKKKEEWKDVSATARAVVNQAVWNAYNAGIPVTRIALEYGTRSRGTIYDIINHERARLAAEVTEKTE